MKTILLLLLSTLPVFGQLGYVSAPTNSPVDGYVVGRTGGTGGNNKWIPGGGVGVTNFITTNTSAGATQAIVSVIDQNARIGPGTLNQIPRFNVVGGTNVADSIMRQESTTVMSITNGVNDGSTALKFLLYGNYTDSTHFDSLGLSWTFARGYQLLTDKGSGGGTSQQLEFGTGGTPWWDLSASGHWLPVNNNASDIGANSDGIRDLWWVRSLIKNGNGSAADLACRLSGGMGWYFSGNTMGFVDVDGPTEYIRFDLGNTPIRHLDIGGVALCGGSATGSPDAFWMRTARGTWGYTNNTAATVPETNHIEGVRGLGSNIPGGKLMIGGGPSTGSGTSGSTGFETATNGAAISTVNGTQTRVLVSAHEVTLTESTATIVANVTVPSKGYLGITVTATTHADDGTDFGSVHEVIAIAAVNKSGTVTTSISASTPMATVTSSGTLVTTWTAVANGGSVDLKCNAVSSLTQTTLKTKYILEINSDGPAVVTEQ